MRAEACTRAPARPAALCAPGRPPQLIARPRPRHRYGWSNICMHYFRRDWLAGVADQLAAAGRYHIAHKKIPSKDGPVQARGGEKGRGAGAAGSGTGAVKV